MVIKYLNEESPEREVTVAGSVPTKIYDGIGRGGIQKILNGLKVLPDI